MRTPKPLLLTPIALALGLAAASASTTLPPRKAGLWQTTMTMTMVMDGQPHGGQPAVTVLCMDPQVEAVEQQKMFGSNCGSLSGSGGSYTLTGSCPAPHGGGTLTTHGTMTMSGDTAAHIDMNTSSPQFSAHVVSESEWIGPCPAGLNPGDLGTMQNGVFVKMGNALDAPPAP